MPSNGIDLRRLEPRSVCLIKPSSLGDVIHATPTFLALRRRWPKARISWVVNRGLSGLVDGLPGLDDVIPFDRSGAGLGPSGLMATGRFLAGLRRRRFDLAVDLQGLFRSGIMAAATGAPVRVGLAEAREGSRCFYTHRISVPDPEMHAVDKLVGIARAFGAEVENPQFAVSVGAADRGWAITALQGMSKPRLVLNVGARWSTKRWPPEHFAAVAGRASRELGASLIVVGAVEDRPLVDRLLDHLATTPVLDLAGRTSLPRLAAVMAESDLVLSNDTGPLHLAVAAGTPVVAIFTCTRPGRTGPYGPEADVVQSQVWCAGSCVRTCPRMECMTELSPDRVWPVVSRRLIEARRAGSAA